MRIPHIVPTAFMHNTTLSFWTGGLEEVNCRVTTALSRFAILRLYFMGTHQIEYIWYLERLSQRSIKKNQNQRRRHETKKTLKPLSFKTKFFINYIKHMN